MASFLTFWDWAGTVPRFKNQQTPQKQKPYPLAQRILTQRFSGKVKLPTTEQAGTNEPMMTYSPSKLCLQSATVGIFTTRMSAMATNSSFFFHQRDLPAHQ